MITPAQFSRKGTADLETAIAAAVTRVLDQAYPGPGGRGTIRFLSLFEDWPTYNDSDLTPSACVLPDGDLMYGPSHPTPNLLEETWEPQVDGCPTGEPGLGLYELSEGSREFEVTIRGATISERNALKAGVESTFEDPSVIFNPVLGSRYGVVAPMPEYWNLPVRIAPVGSRKMDNADDAGKNIWQATFRLRAEAAHVKLGIVQPFRVRVRPTIT